MIRLGRAYALLTTINGWCFLRRNNTNLEITKMYGDFIAVDQVTQGAKAEGYYLLEGMTILKALYFFSHLADTAPLAPVIVNGVPGRCNLPLQSHLDTDPRIIIEGKGNPQDDFDGLRIVGGYDHAQSYQFCDGILQSLQFEPWDSANVLGPKTWLARTLPPGDQVVLKLWDAWKFIDIDQIQEAKIYLKLKPIWGKYVPALLVQSPLEFYHCLVLRHVKVLSLAFEI